MAERLKDRFGEDIPHRIAEMIVGVDAAFDTAGFVADALTGYEPLSLTGRARNVADALANHLPADRDRAIEILVESLGPPYETEELDGMDSFLYLPHVYFVADHGLAHFETSMRAQHELTRRFTAEFSIRAFLEAEPARTLERLFSWCDDPDPHVRRLVSEGTRPRLPWAARLDMFIADPGPVLGLLDRLHLDPSPYVRRSVANNVNDISKDHPDAAIETVRGWLRDTRFDRRVASRGLRTLVKQGHPAALETLGFSHGSPAGVTCTCRPTSVAIGDKVRLEVTVTNPTAAALPVLIDLVVHFVKANGLPSAKVFKGRELEVPPGDTATFRKTITLAPLSTRTPRPGTHRIEVLVNGEAREGSAFEVIEAPIRSDRRGPR